MFEAICIARQTQDDAEATIDAGLLAEALLFYQKVTVFGHSEVLRQLIRICGVDALTTLVDEGHLAFVYDPVLGGVATENATTAFERHTLVNVEPEHSSLQDVAPSLFLAATGKPGRSRRLARRFIEHSSEPPHDRRILDAARSDLEDAHYVQECAKSILLGLAPEYEQPLPIEFSLREHGGYIHVSTNIDFAAANEVYHRRVPPSRSSLSPAQLLVMILEAREHISLAASQDAELLVSPTRSKLVRLRMDCLIDRVSSSHEQLAHFQDLVFSDARAVREVVSSGQRSIADLLPLLDNARRWKKWLSTRPPDSDLLREYWSATFSKSWLDRLPTKIARWTLFTGAGVAFDLAGGGGLGTALGIAASAADATIVQKVVSGWKPHQFVEESMRKLIAPE